MEKRPLALQHGGLAELDKGSLVELEAESQLVSEERIGHEEVKIVFPTVLEVLLKRTKNRVHCRELWCQRRGFEELLFKMRGAKAILSADAKRE